MNKKDKITQRGVISFFLSFLICLLFIVPAINNRISKDQIQLENLLSDRSIQASEAISIPINQLYTVASYIANNNGSLDGIEKLVDIVVSSNYVKSLVIAPNGIVEHIYPINKVNEATLGLNFYDSEIDGNKEAIIAAFSKEILLAGPFTTLGGDKVISARLPLYISDEKGNEVLWGLLSLSLDYPAVMETTGLDNIGKQGYLYELWHTNVDTGLREIITSNGVIDEKDNYLDKSLKVQNAEWNLRIAPLPKWYEYMETWIYITLSLAVSTMVSLMVKKNLQLHSVTNSLENLVNHDLLTGLLSRQGLYSEIEKLKKEGTELLVYYLDINDFKSINDSFGHAIGDEVLVEFAKRINKHLVDNHFFCRMGGDEFILVSSSGFNTEQKMAPFWEAVNNELKTPLSVNGQDIYISFSHGVASYSSETDYIGDIISKADHEMYLKKKIYHDISQ